MKRPSFQFYPKDWLSDLRLRSLSSAARGLWADLMCLMHDGTPYGHLAIDYRPMDDESAAKLTGLLPKEYQRLLAEIEDRGVSSRTADGVLFSRRMVRDQEIRELRAKAGQVGGRFAQAKVRANVKQTTEQSVKQMVAAAEADAEGSSGKEGAGEKPHAPLVARFAPGDRPAVEHFLAAVPVHLSRDTWAGVLRGCLQGLNMPQGRPASPDAVAAACRDYPALVGSGQWSPLHFRKCVERAEQAPNGAPEDPFDAAARRLEAAEKAGKL